MRLTLEITRKLEEKLQRVKKHVDYRSVVTTHLNCRSVEHLNVAVKLTLKHTQNIPLTEYFTINETVGEVKMLTLDWLNFALLCVLPLR